MHLPWDTIFFKLQLVMLCSLQFHIIAIYCGYVKFVGIKFHEMLLYVHIHVHLLAKYLLYSDFVDHLIFV